MKRGSKIVLNVDEEDVKKVRAYLLSQGKTLTDGLIDEVNYVIDNNIPIPIENPVEKFLDIRQRLIEKYGTIKEASKHTNVSYRTLMTAIEKIERNKNYRPYKSTSKMLMDLLEKKIY